MIKKMINKFYYLWLDGINKQSKNNNKPLLENARKSVALVALLTLVFMFIVTFILKLPYVLVLVFTLSILTINYFYQRLLKEQSQHKDK